MRERTVRLRTRRFVADFSSGRRQVATSTCSAGAWFFQFPDLRADGVAEGSRRHVVCIKSRLLKRYRCNIRRGTLRVRYDDSAAAGRRLIAARRAAAFEIRFEGRDDAETQLFPTRRAQRRKIFPLQHDQPQPQPQPQPARAEALAFQACRCSPCLRPCQVTVLRADDAIPRPLLSSARPCSRRSHLHVKSGGKMRISRGARPLDAETKSLPLRLSGKGLSYEPPAPGR